MAARSRSQADSLWHARKQDLPAAGSRIDAAHEGVCGSHKGSAKEQIVASERCEEEPLFVSCGHQRRVKRVGEREWLPGPSIARCAAKDAARRAQAVGRATENLPGVGDIDHGWGGSDR
jgi:hypothetical protein